MGLPTVAELLLLMAMEPSQIKPGSNEEKKLAWFYEELLPSAAGTHYWGADIRHFKKLGEPVSVGTHSFKCNVTISSESWALLMLENCHAKWTEMKKFKEENPSKDVPRKGDDSTKYDGKFTDAKNGQKKYGGWNQDGFDFFNKVQQQLKTIRESDAANGHQFYKFIYDMLRRINNIVTDAPVTVVKPRNKNNKRGRDNDSDADSDGPAIKIVCFDEDD